MEMGRGLRGSGLSEGRQLDPPERSQWRGREGQHFIASEGVAGAGAYGIEYTVERRRMLPKQE